MPTVRLEVVPAIALPPADVVPESVRPALSRYAVEGNAPARAALVVEVDRVGHGWELQLASRAVAARAELGEACRRAIELHDELVSLRAAAAWLRLFPWRSSWEPEPYTLHLPAREATLAEVLDAVEGAVDVDDRLVAIARRRLPRDSPYEPPVRRGRPGSPALVALAAAGPMLTDVAEVAEASESAVSLWLSGRRSYPDRLLYALEKLLGAEPAARILALIPSPQSEAA